MLGAAWIAGRAVLPAIQASRNGRLVALASRDPSRARTLLGPYPDAKVCEGYDALLEMPGVDAVYIPLVNTLHREWAVRALRAGKHVLCEKPLALNAAEASEMRDVAVSSGRQLMEALMYRFHPAMQEFVAAVVDPLYVQAGFGFTLADASNYRARPELGGGALLDLGCYVVSVARWILGEPAGAFATARFARGVDTTVASLLEFEGGRAASLWVSFESPEEQELTVVMPDRVVRRNQPFTAWRDPHDPYVLMVESFAESALAGTRPAIPLEESIANLAVLDRLRSAMTAPPRSGGGQVAGRAAVDRDRPGKAGH